MTITFYYHGKTSVPVEIEGLTPDWAVDKTLSEIEQFEIFEGNRRIPLGEMFRVTGSPGDRNMVFEGDLAGVHWIGSHMASGTVRVVGHAGRHVGSQMKGGQLTVEGNAGGWVGAEMKRGRIHIHGNAGHLVGAAYRGASRGMTGGTILVDGNAGNETGLTMRRGMIAIGGNCGDLAGFNMIAGSILIFGECGIRPGAGMRRGTIGILGPNPPQLLPSFRYSSTLKPQILSVMLRFLRSHNFSVDSSLMASAVDVYRGDLVSLGLGEILFLNSQAG
ncbi:MAG: formylmethanofuran dehydrogenase subunit C [Planctomycetia bacterium]